MFIPFDIDYPLHEDIPLVLPAASGSHPPLFVSCAFESDRGTRKTGAEENISKHRDKEETERQCKFTQTAIGFMFCVPLWSRMFVCMCVHLHRDCFCELRTCSGSLADDTAVIWTD